MYPAQQNATDQTANFFWFLVIIFGAVLIVWWLFRQWIIVPIYLFRYYELDLLKYSIDAWAAIAGFLHLPVPHLSNILTIQHHIVKTNASHETFANFAQVNSYVGKWTRYPAAVLLLILSVIIYFRHTAARFHTTYSMKTLKKSEVENWPQITPVLSLDLVNTDPEKGPWAMAKLPLNFCREHELIYPKKAADGSIIWGLHRGPAHRIFVMQLGPLWRGVDSLPIHIKALIAIFVARAEKEKEIAKKLLTQISSSASSGKLDFTGVEELIQRYKNSRVLKWLEKQHAYLNTLMPSLLEIARADGVLATAEFLWLKPLDRRLWYVLNSVGRQTAVVEVAGPFSHWLAERKVKRALKTPMVKEAVNALETCMEDTLHIQAGERWHTTNVA